MAFLVLRRLGGRDGAVWARDREGERIRDVGSGEVLEVRERRREFVELNTEDA